MNSMTRILLGFFFIICAHVASAETLSIERTIEFVDHEYSVVTDLGGQFLTNHFDNYAITSTDPVVVPAGTYDRIELTITVGPGNLLEVDDVATDVIFEIDAVWNSGSLSGSFEPIEVSYDNGTPNLPATGTGILTNDSGTNGVFIRSFPSTPSDAFSFRSVTISRNVPATAFTSEVVWPFDRGNVEFWYQQQGEFPPAGSFTRIVPEPTSLMLLGLGSLALVLRGRRQ
jgi:hypothetical protein